VECSVLNAFILLNFVEQDITGTSYQSKYLGHRKEQAIAFIGSYSSHKRSCRPPTAGPSIGLERLGSRVIQFPKKANSSKTCVVCAKKCDRNLTR